MKKMVVAALLAAGASSVNAGIFDGQTLRYEYYYPDQGTLYAPVLPELPPDNGNYLVSAAVEIGNIASNVGTLDLQSDGFTATFIGSGTFGSAAFNGFAIMDVMNAIPAFASFAITSNSGLDTDPALGFDGNNLYVNWAGMPFHAGSLVFAVTAVPEPESYALLLAGVGLLAFAARRRRRKS